MSFVKVMEAYKKGYRVKGNKIVSPRGIHRKTFLPKGGYYPKFSIKMNGNYASIKCHQLTAYQMYGRTCLNPNLVVRHLDDNGKNFRESNIRLGTKETNMNDKYINAILQYWIQNFEEIK